MAVHRSFPAWCVAACLPLVLDARPTPEISWRPDPPRQGSLVVVIVKPAEVSPAPVTGTLAGQALHFEPDDQGRLVALGAVPLSARDSVTLRIAVGGADSLTRRVGVAARRVRREALRTDPRFTAPPDSALAARIARERELVAATIAPAHASPRLWSRPFARPRQSRIASDFGFEREFNGGVESRHMGVDFAGQRGAPVRAANRGVVALVADLFYAGRTVYVNHGAGLVTGYLHLDRALVAVGDTVERGQVIGRVGASGRVTGPHLHWLARYGEIAVDPLDLVTLDLTPLATPAPSPSPPRP